MTDLSCRLCELEMQQAEKHALAVTLTVVLSGAVPYLTSLFSDSVSSDFTLVVYLYRTVPSILLLDWYLYSILDWYLHSSVECTTL